MGARNITKSAGTRNVQLNDMCVGPGCGNLKSSLEEPWLPPTGPPLLEKGGKNRGELSIETVYQPGVSEQSRHLGVREANSWTDALWGHCRRLGAGPPLFLGFSAQVWG